MRERSGFRPNPRASRVLATALAATLIVTSGLAAAPAQAATARVAISYRVFAAPLNSTVCVGDRVKFQVSISRSTTVNGQRHQQWVSGGYILGVIGDRSVGGFEPEDAGRDVGAAPLNVAKFTFVAKAPGRTRIEFQIRNTGEERRVGTGFPERGETVAVEVVACFDAYTSGLATVFTTKDMGDLTEPFFLEGHLSTATIGGATQFMFFAPNPQNHTTGGYAFIDTAWPLAGPQGNCTAYVSGRYDVVLYGDPARPVEGDLLMKGTGVAVCGGIPLPIDYRSVTGFQIGFRPRAAAP